MANPDDAARAPSVDPAAVGICLETLLADPFHCEVADFERIVDAASAAGFECVGLWSQRPVELGAARVRHVLDRSGMRVRVAELRTRWAAGPVAAVSGIEEQLDLAESLGAHSVLAVSQETTMDMPAATDGFAALCDRAARRGLTVTIEFLPCRALRDLATAWQVVDGSGAVNGGIDLDLMHWHYQPGGRDLDLLRSIPAQHLHYVQLCDASGPAPQPHDYISTAIRARPLPGDGDVDIAAVLSCLDDIAAEPFFAMEVFNARLLADGPESLAMKLRAAADGLFGVGTPGTELTGTPC